MFKKLLFTFIVCLLCGANLSAQTTHWVKAGGAGLMDGTSEANAFATIADAYTAAATGDASTRDIINIVGTVAHGAVLTLDKNLDFKGISSGTIDASTSTDRVFGILARTINFDDLTISNSAPGGTVQGAVASIWSACTVTYTNVTFSNNTSAHHAGVLQLGNGTHTFSGCTFSNNAGAYFGGVVFATGSSTLNFTNTSFSSNSSTSSDGGVFYINANSTVNLTTCTFTGNSAPEGGAIYSVGTLVESGSTFTSNTSTGAGGAIYAGGATNMSISNSTFTSNTSSGNNGGAIYHTATTTPTITGSTFSSNSANNGGAIYENFDTSTNLTISGSAFLSNTATAGSAGAIYNLNAPMTITTSTIANNTATGAGGAIFLGGDDTNTSTFTNVTFYGNGTASTPWPAFGGGIRIDEVTSGAGSRTVNFNNCLFNNNRVGINDGSPPADASDVWARPDHILVFNNCIVENGSGFSVGAGDTNSGSTFLEDLSESSLSFVSPNLTFSAPTSKDNASPIDYGTDNEDIGSWNSNITFFKGGTDSDWATAGNWPGNVPTATDNVTLLSDSPAIVIGATTGAVANDLSVDAGTTLNITSGGSLILSGSSTGNITYNLAVADVNWHTFSAPVSGEQFDTTWADNNNIATGTESASNRGISWYNNGTADGTTGYWRYYTGGAATTFGQGDGYSMKSTGATTYSFTGSYSSGNLSPSISMGAGTTWNLIGNSFSSYISIADFLTNNSANIADAFNAVYVWNGATYSMLTTGKLYPGQAFFINSKVNGNAAIASSLQSHDTGTSLLKAPSTPSIKLMISDNESNYSTDINYLEGKTKGLDSRFDLGKFSGVAADLSIYTHLVSNSQGIDFARQSLPNSDLENMIIPVGINAVSGKEITISADALNLPQGLKVFLEDRVNNTFTRLDEANSNLKITINEDLSGTGRFYLHTKSSVLSTDNLNLDTISIYKTSSSNLRIAGLTQGKSNLRLFNIQGKQVMSTSFTSKNGVNDISLPSLSTGIYIVQLETENGMLNKKITLE